MGSPDDRRQKTTAEARKAERETRLADALRANLRRRKAQAAGQRAADDGAARPDRDDDGSAH